MTPPLSAAAPATVAEQAFLQIRADILAAKFRPGEKMRIEHLRQIYGLGATPLREALSKLSSLDLVVAEGQRGFRVAPVSVANLLDITRTRAWIEGLALRASIAAGDLDWEAEILGAAHRLELNSPSQADTLSEPWYQANRTFHDALVAACRSPQIMAFRSQLYDLSDRYRRLSVQNGLQGRDLDKEHDLILDAVLSKDADAAVTLIEAHFVETARVILVGGIVAAPEVERLIEQLSQDIRDGLPHRAAHGGPA